MLALGLGVSMVGGQGFGGVDGTYLFWLTLFNNLIIFKIDVRLRRDVSFFSLFDQRKF